MLRLFRRKIYLFRLVTISLFSTLAFSLSNAFFDRYPLLGPTPHQLLSVVSIINHLGPLLTALVAGYGVYTYLPRLFLSAQTALGNFITQIVFQTLTEFFRDQNRRLAESRAASEKAKLEKIRQQAQTLEHKNSIVVDTSSLIDGRLLALAKSGFLDQPLIVPQCVIDELQHIADSADKGRRERGRFGLDILNTLKKQKTPPVAILGHEEGSDEPVVDKRLVKLAQRLKARLLTVDFNLNKVATASGVKVLNVNTLATDLRTTLLPGETLKIKLTTSGKDAKQGVGYLLDGTMIVVEKGSDKIGQEVSVEVTRVLQTAAGKMFFGKLV